MLKRLILIGAFLIGIVISSGFEANAGTISGWSYRCCSHFTGDIDLKGVPNPDSKPTVVIALMTLQLESVCRNPAGGSFSTQVIHFLRTVQQPLSAIQGTVGSNGKITVHVDVNLEDLVSDADCTNGSGAWQVLDNSTGVTAAGIHQDWYYCTTSDCSTYNPSKPIDSANIACTLLNPPFQRNTDGTTKSEQPFSCPEI